MNAFRRKAKSGSRLVWFFWETLIIVVGVLIALAMDDYWTDRQERRMEVDYLKRFHSDLMRDIEWIEGYRARSIERKLQALEAVAPVVRGIEPVPADPEVFLVNVSLAGVGGVSPNYWVTKTTFTDLTATGNLRLIQDPRMRGKISDYYLRFDNDHKRLVARVSGYPLVVHRIFPSELRTGINLASIEEFGTDRALALVQSAQFEDLFNQEYNFGLFLRDMHDHYLNLTRELAAEFQQHIEELERGL